jgi:hypothetical protein
MRLQARQQRKLGSYYSYYLQRQQQQGRLLPSCVRHDERLQVLWGQRVQLSWYLPGRVPAQRLRRGWLGRAVRADQLLLNYFEQLSEPLRNLPTRVPMQ